MSEGAPLGNLTVGRGLNVIFFFFLIFFDATRNTDKHGRVTSVCVSLLKLDVFFEISRAESLEKSKSRTERICKLSVQSSTGYRTTAT